MISNDSKLETIRDFVRWGASEFNRAQLFYGHGTDNAIDEALQLVMHAIHLDYSLPDEYLDCRVTDEEWAVITQLFQRRIEERIPAAYLTGKAYFAGMEFEVTPDVLVPRSPIGELISQGFEPWLDARYVTSVLDLCTGSGCIAISCAQAMPHAEVDAVDLSETALAVAERNIAKYHMGERVHLHRSDLFDDLPNKQYNLILSNPPYVSHDEYHELPAEYHHEPKLGLAAGASGLDIVERILSQANRFLAPGGIMIVEVGSAAEALIERYPEYPFLWLDFEHGGDGVFLLKKEQLGE